MWVGGWWCDGMGGGTSPHVLLNLMMFVCWQCWLHPRLVPPAPNHVRALCLQAVRTALAGARNVEGFQEVLEQLPEDIITEICK